MAWFIILSGLIAPAIFWLGYFYYKDRYLPEPPLEAGISYILDFFAAFACIKIYGLLPLLNIPSDPGFLMENNRLLFFLYCIGVVGLLEECFKLLPFLIVISCFKAFDEKIDVNIVRRKIEVENKKPHYFVLRIKMEKKYLTKANCLPLKKI